MISHLKEQPEERRLVAEKFRQLPYPICLLDINALLNYLFDSYQIQIQICDCCYHFKTEYQASVQNVAQEWEGN